VSQASASQGSFAPSVAGPDNDDVISCSGNIQGIPQDAGKTRECFT